MLDFNQTSQNQSQICTKFRSNLKQSMKVKPLQHNVSNSKIEEPKYQQKDEAIDDTPSREPPTQARGHIQLSTHFFEAAQICTHLIRGIIHNFSVGVAPSNLFSQTTGVGSHIGSKLEGCLKLISNIIVISSGRSRGPSNERAPFGYFQTFTSGVNSLSVRFLTKIIFQ